MPLIREDGPSLRYAARMLDVSTVQTTYQRPGSSRPEKDRHRPRTLHEIESNKQLGSV